jgi:hypothetical protein
MSMFVVDEVVFSIECFEWFTDRRENVVIPDETIDVFRPLLPKEYREGLKKKNKYMELNAGEFWDLFKEVFMLLSDVHKSYKLPRKVTILQLRIELLKLEKLIIFWALSTEHEEHTLGKLDKDFIGVKGCLNNVFCTHSYYTFLACQWSVDRLEGVINGRDFHDMGEHEKGVNGLFIMTVNRVNEYYGDVGEENRFMKDLVRIGYGGDFDEFIISVKESIANQTMGPYHQKLALVLGYELMGIADFTTVSHTEVWRRLFSTYFDLEEDNFVLFYNTYTHQCIFYVLLDFLSIDKNDAKIDYIPVYRCFSANKFTKTLTDDIKRLINTKLIKKKLYSLYNKKIK